MAKIYGLGEILVRLNVNKPLSHFNNQIETIIGGSEYNILATLAGWGHDCQMISLLPNSFWGKLITQDLALKKVKSDLITFKQGDQSFYLVENYQNDLPLNVTYNRQGGVFTKEIKALSNVNFGAKDDYLVFSGISLLLSEEVFETVLKIIQNAYHKGLKIIFDFNYRASMSNHLIARKRYLQILPYCNIVFANQNDLTKILTYNPQAKLELILQKFCQDFKLDCVAFTKRKGDNKKQSLIGNIFINEQLITSQEHFFLVVDRIGGGDAFAAGIIDALINLNNNNLIKTATLDLAIYSAIYVQQFVVDNLSVTKEQLLNSFNQQNQGLKR